MRGQLPLAGDPAEHEPAATEEAAPAAASEPEPRKAEPRKAEPVPASPARRRRPAAKRAAKTPSQPVAPMPIEQRADTARPQRLMVPLSIEEDRSLKTLRLDDGIPAAARIRAMLAVYREDQRYRRKVDEAARRMR